MINRFVAVCLLFLWVSNVSAQDPKRFQNDVDEIHKKDSSYKNKKVILFTGSSTIRMWKNIHHDYENKPVVNHGFGGSEMSDLLYYANDLILQYRPFQIIIYEGDNDIKSGKSPKEILSSADSLLKKIRHLLPTVPVYFISAKPSIARWNLKEQYLGFNSQLKAFTMNHKDVYYLDLWNPMLDGHGIVMQDIFIEDGLHMNAKGYAIWKKEIGQHLK